jgi:hypothetical protein
MPALKNGAGMVGNRRVDQRWGVAGIGIATVSGFIPAICEPIFRPVKRVIETLAASGRVA